MTMLAFLGGLEVWVILGAALLLFGHRIPKVANSLGQGIVEFRKGLKGQGSEPEKRLPEGDAKPGSGEDGGESEDS